LFNGVGIGLFFGAYMNLPNAFIAKYYPHAIAQARGVPFPFLNFGLMLGPVLLPFLGPNSYHVGWVVSGVLQFCATMNLLIVAGKIARATKWQVESPVSLLPVASPAPRWRADPASITSFIQAGELSSKLRGGATQALALAKLQAMQRAHNLDAWDEKGTPCPKEAKALPAISYVGNCG